MIKLKSNFEIYEFVYMYMKTKIMLKQLFYKVCNRVPQNHQYLNFLKTLQFLKH